MKVYHSSTVKVEYPDTAHSRSYLDFGRGFYLTTIREQAVKYAERFLRRGSEALLNTYEMPDDIIGGIANDKVFRTIDLYFAGDITKQQALNKLVYEKPNIQLCIRSEQMLRQCLTLINSEKL